MVTHWVEDRTDYTGEQFRSHWAYATLGIAGDSIVAFVGGCEVHGDALVDLEDARAGDRIVAKSMLHFIVEHFDSDLERTILRQRLLVAILAQLLTQKGIADLTRDGDDLFLNGRKLTVSIATASPVSTLVHLGVNVDPTGAPVPAVGLEELSIEPKPLAIEVMEAYCAEMESALAARAKVRGVN